MSYLKVPTGKLLLVDLSSGKVETISPGEELYRSFLGGYGLGVRFILDHQPPKVNPLSEESWLGLIPGLLVGLGIPFASRTSIVGKSPLTGTWGDTSVGGYMGEAIRKAGFDGIFIRGRAQEPVYLLVEAGHGELRPAEHLWGKDTYIVQELLKRELGEGLAVACIGPAGERCALTSCIIHDRGRAAARSGLGAVMGAKNLKAVAVRGTFRLQAFAPDALENLCKEIEQHLGYHPSILGRMVSSLSFLAPLAARLKLDRLFRGRQTDVMVELFHKYGTTLGLGVLVTSGATPIKNWAGRREDFPLSKARRLGEKAIASRVIRDYGCAGCPVRCGGEVRVKEGEARRPEYEVLGSFGPLLLNSDLDTIMELYHLCNLYGLDVIEVGTAIAWAIEGFERGRLGVEDTGGIELRWGDSTAIMKLARLIVCGYGIGELLSQGVASACRKFGGEEWAVHVGGQAPGMWHPRYDPYYGLTYISDPTPGRHTAGNAAWGSSWGDSFPLKGISIKGRAPGERQALWSNFIQVVNSLGLCLFYIDLGELPLPELILAATGWSYLNTELLEIGDKVQSLRQAFNLREDVPPESFSLPPRLQEGLKADIESWRRQYYRAMGWGPEGRPRI